MCDNKKLSFTYRLLRKIGFNYPEEEYGQISPWVVIKRVCKTYRDTFLLNCIMDSWLLAPFAPRRVRPWVLRKIGCHVGKDVFIGSQVWVDYYAKLAYMKGEIHIGKGCSTGTGSMIMPGVTIGDGAIVGAYSLVTKDVPAWTIATGRPAKVVKEISGSNCEKILMGGG